MRTPPVGKSFYECVCTEIDLQRLAREFRTQKIVFETAVVCPILSGVLYGLKADVAAETGGI
jgi:hypothetical protein